MTSQNLSRQLADALHLEHPAVAVIFDADDCDGRPSPAPEPAACCFWIAAETGRVDTRSADHAPCSVGSYTHGFIDLDTAAASADVAALVSTGWVGPADLLAAARLSQRPRTVTYRPLAEVSSAHVVLARLSATGLMTLAGAVPGLSLVTKPQCQIVALAAAGHVAVSPGCAVSRARTTLPADELTCALPGAALEQLIDQLEAAAGHDQAAAELVSTTSAGIG